MLGAETWARALTPEGFQWHGADLGAVTDATLTSPPLEVSANDPLTISFEHRHKFEFSENTYWDGGLVELTEDVIADYVACREWVGKAGAYALQGIAGSLVRSISGSVTNVIGLPVAEVIAALREVGGPLPRFVAGIPS